MLKIAMEFSRRQVLVAGSATLASAAAGLGYALFVEPRWPEITRHVIPTRWLQKNARLRVLHLSDLHASAAIPLEWLREVFRLALDESPDCICLTGDYVTTGDNSDLTSYSDVLSILSQAAPTFASMGNHDGGRWGEARGRPNSSVATRALLRSAGIQVPHNAHVETKIAGQRMQFVGLGDHWAKELNARVAFQELPREADCFRIVLSHNPDTKAMLQYFSWEMMLSGHTHGGQVVVPLLGPPILPIEDKAYFQGLHTWKARRLYITRGVGGVLGGIRINCRPEITILDFVAGESPELPKPSGTTTG